VPLFIAAAVVAGLVAGWATGGSLARLGSARLRLVWLAPLALGAQLYLVRAVGSEVPWWVWPVHVGSYALLLAVVLANRRLPGLPVIGLGLLLNAAVIGANGGLMPQAPETAQLRHPGDVLVIGRPIPNSKDVLLPRQATRLWWLSDFVVVPSGGHRPLVASPGDVVLALGLAVTVCGLMRPPARAEGRRVRTLQQTPEGISK
jgi:Family of unknown function (DUF5317)